MIAKKDAPQDEALLKCLLPPRQNTVRQLFNDEGLRAPEIIWSPKGTELVSPIHRQFMKRVAQLANETGCIPQDRFDLNHFQRFDDWLIHLKIEYDGAAFRYLHYGAAVGQVAGEDMAGRLSSDHGGYTEIFLTTLYRAALRMQAPVYSYHESPREMFTRGWHRMIVPIVDASGTPVAFLVMAVADNELAVGLEMLSDPVFVVNAAHGVAYCNRAARRFFDLPPIIERNVPFNALTGFDLTREVVPDDLLDDERTVSSVELVERGGLMEHLDVVLGAAEHRGQAFFIVSIRFAGT